RGSACKLLDLRRALQRDRQVGGGAQLLERGDRGADLLPCFREGTSAGAEHSDRSAYVVLRERSMYALDERDAPRFGVAHRNGTIQQGARGPAQRRGLLEPPIRSGGVIRRLPQVLGDESVLSTGHMHQAQQRPCARQGPWHLLVCGGRDRLVCGRPRVLEPVVPCADRPETRSQESDALVDVIVGSRRGEGGLG